MINKNKTGGHKQIYTQTNKSKKKKNRPTSKQRKTNKQTKNKNK